MLSRVFIIFVMGDLAHQNVSVLRCLIICIMYMPNFLCMAREGLCQSEIKTNAEVIGRVSGRVAEERRRAE